MPAPSPVNVDVESVPTSSSISSTTSVVVDANAVLNSTETLVNATQPMAEIVLLANRLKRLYEDHIDSDGAHMVNDITNIITVPDAFDIESAITLLNALKQAFNSHRVQGTIPGVQNSVHANVAVIRFEAPERVAYSSVKLVTESTGVEGLLSSFSDDGGGVGELV